jgi:hypothetical protein
VGTGIKTLLFKPTKSPQHHNLQEPLCVNLTSPCSLCGLKDIVVVVDGDEYSVDDRVRSIVNSLASRGAPVEGLQRDSVCNQVYISRVTVGGRSLRLLIAVNGDFFMLFKRHCLEDHCVKLMRREVVEGVGSSKHLVSVDECLEYMGE